MDNFCVYLDAGHGGLDALGHYTTAPSKMWHHPSGSFHHGSIFYEGVWNRTMLAALTEELRQRHIEHLCVSHPWVDVPLIERVRRANAAHAHYKRGLFISLHANAFNTHTRGWEIYHFPGSAMGRYLAEHHHQRTLHHLGDRIILRRRPVRAMSFYVLRHTTMPALLVEHGYFDNAEDATLLMQPTIVQGHARAHADTIEYYATLNA